MYIWLELKEAVFDLPYLHMIWICNHKLYAMETSITHKSEVSRDWSMQYIDIEYSIIKVINNEMTYKYSAHGYLQILEKKVTRSFQSCVEMLSNWFDFGVLSVTCDVVDKSYTTVLWIVFQKDLCISVVKKHICLFSLRKDFAVIILLELNSKIVKSFRYQCFFLNQTRQS